MSFDNNTGIQRGLTFRSAVILFLVVVFGALTAMQVNSWVLEREDRQLAARLTGDLINDLIVEGRLMRSTVAYFEVVFDYVKQADNAFAMDAPEDSGAFLTALYNSSQVTTPQRIGAEYQALVKRGEAHLISPDLARLMVRHYSSKNLPLLSRTVSGSLYRELIRRQMPSQVQIIIREQCGDLRGKEGYVDALSQNCDVDFGTLDIDAIAAKLHANEVLRDALAHMRGNLESSLIDNRADLRHLDAALAEIQL